MTQLHWYRLAEGTLGVESADEALSSRFEEIYGDCRVETPAEGPTVECRTTTTGLGSVRATFTDPESLDEARFLCSVFPERRYQPVTMADGSVVLRLPGTTDDVVLHHGTVSAPAHAAWQPLVANLAVSRLLRLQRSLCFFHAASAQVRGGGLLVCGPKRSGKTTLALGLAARGHAVLGDEIAALHLADRALMPFRRSVAVREGPSSDSATRILDASPRVTERYPDGEIRHRLQWDQVSPIQPPDRVPLTTVLILSHFSARTAVQARRVGPDLLAVLGPLAASLWDRPAGAVAMQLLRAFAGAKVYEVNAGPPDEMVDRIEHLMGE